MDEAFDASAAVAEAGPAEIGDTGAEAIEQPEVGDEPPARQYVEIDDPDNRYVRVKVDGEDVEVPFSEALKGYSREADYTRKAQMVAQQRQEAEYGINLQRALEANPEMTFRILAERYGISFAQQVAAQQQQAPEEEDYVDPLERAIAQERKAREALEQRLSQREEDERLEKAVNGLRQQFNLSNEDLQEVIGIAYQNGYGIEALPMIYKTMAYDRLSARVAAARAADEAKKAETSRRQTAKTDAQVVSNRSSGSNGLTSQVDSGGRMSLREAIEAAYDVVERG